MLSGGRLFRPVCSHPSAELHVLDDPTEGVDIGTRQQIYRLGALADQGIALQRLEAISPVRFRQVLDVNLAGAFLCCRTAMPLLRRSGGGSAVTISSVHAVTTAPGRGAYAASKGGITALTRQLAVNYATYGIRANSVLAGSVDTRIIRAVVAAA
jgi:NAD(P)-dependent dehydrogenase (short-subunit alcohol dehydrogenase family)